MGGGGGGGGGVVGRALVCVCVCVRARAFLCVCVCVCSLAFMHSSRRKREEENAEGQQVEWWSGGVVVEWASRYATMLGPVGGSMPARSARFCTVLLRQCIGLQTAVPNAVLSTNGGRCKIPERRAAERRHVGAQTHWRGAERRVSRVPVKERELGFAFGHLHRRLKGLDVIPESQRFALRVGKEIGGGPGLSAAAAAALGLFLLFLRTRGTCLYANHGPDNAIATGGGHAPGTPVRGTQQCGGAAPRVGIAVRRRCRWYTKRKQRKPPRRGKGSGYLFGPFGLASIAGRFRLGLFGFGLGLYEHAAEPGAT